jgi:hypothetical protein
MLPAPGAATAQRNRFPYWQSGQTTLAASAGAGLVGASEQFNINVNDHNFNGLQLLAQSTGKFLCQIVVNGRAFTSAPTHSDNMFGNAQLPFNLALPMTFPRGTVVQITMYDISGAQNVVNWAIHGYQHD